MRTQPIVACVTFVVLAAGGAWSADGADASAMTAAAVVTTSAVASVNADVDPWIHPKISDGVRGKLQTAVQIAVARIDEVESCRDLFANLGADGKEMLATTLYFPVAPHNRRDGICKQAVAYTKVGGKSTFVCPEFSRLSDERAAMFVVHEALHHAGLTEKPQDRRGMTSLEINTMVGTNCGF